MTIHAALVAAFGELTNPPKDRTANAGHYSYKYADLATIIDHVRPILAKHDLAVTQNVTVEDSRLEVWTYVHHSSGEVLTYGPIVGRPGADWQGLGSAVTYARRYALGAALGLAPEEDDDGVTAPKLKVVEKKPKIERVTVPVDPDPWQTPPPVDPETGEQATLDQAVTAIADKLGGELVETLPGDKLNGPARRRYDNEKRGASDKQKYAIRKKLEAVYPEVVDEDSALVQAVAILCEAGDAQPGEVDGWEDLTRRMIDRLFAVGGGK